MVENQETFGKTETLLREGYSSVAKNKGEETIIAITNLIDRYSTGTISFKAILDEATRTMHRVLDFQYICIAIRDVDGKYRYKTSIGLMPEATRSLFQIAYSDSDLFDDANYPSTDVSDISRFYMSENAPYKPDETSSYSRPVMLTQKRGAPDDMIEADYIDVYIKGEKKEILGYIEAGKTRNGRLPDKRNIRWLETIARMLSIIFSREMSEGI